MGVPILILPSLYDLDGTLWALSIVIWVVSVLQGFLQNMAIGEMAANFGVSGIGACAQYVFTDEEKYKGKKVNRCVHGVVILVHMDACHTHFHYHDRSLPPRQ